MLADLLPNAGIDPESWSLGVELVMGTFALFLAAADRVDARTRAAWRNRAIAAFLGFLVAGVAAEAGTRWAFRDITTSADSGSLFSRDWARGSVLLNPEGFRERSVTMPKPAGTYRIAAIGDSFTFGTGLEPHQRCSDLMNTWLPDRFEVVAVYAEQGITCLDLRKDFDRVHDRRSLWVSPFDHHPCAKANAIAAAEIIAMTAIPALRMESSTRFNNLAHSRKRVTSLRSSFGAALFTRTSTDRGGKTE